MVPKQSIREVVESFTKRAIAEDESLFDSGLLDSFTLPDMVTSLEQKFGVHVPDSELIPQNFDSLNRIHELLQSKF